MDTVDGEAHLRDLKISLFKLALSCLTDPQASSLLHLSLVETTSSEDSSRVLSNCALASISYLLSLVVASPDIVHSHFTFVRLCCTAF
jgi:hypothetical protein